MALDFVERVKGFLLNPVESFNKYKNEEFGDAFKYYICLLVILSVLYAIIATIGFGSMMGVIPGAGAGALTFVIVLVFMIIAGIIGLFIGSIIIHIFVLILGGKQGFMKTVKAMIYSSTPSMLLGWIPIIGFIAGIWAFVLEILAIREIQEMSTIRAVFVILLPVIIVFVLVVLLFGFLIFAAASSMGY